MKRLLAIAALALASPSLGQDRVTSQTAAQLERAWKNARPSVVLILTTDEAGLPMAMGSGFYVERTTIVTNHRVVEGAANFHIKPLDGSKTFQASRVTKRSEGLDLALLEVTRPGPPLELADVEEEKVWLGTQVVVLGSTNGLEPRTSRGIVSSVPDFPSFQPLALTAAVSPGLSGGPVLLPSGKVLGVSGFWLLDNQLQGYTVSPEPLLALSKEESSWEPEMAARSGQSAADSRASDPRGKGRPSVGSGGGKPKRLGPPALARAPLGGVELALYKAPFGAEEFLSLRNATSQPISGVVGVLLYKTQSDGGIYDYKVVSIPDVLPPGVGKLRKLPGGKQSDHIHFPDAQPHHRRDNSYLLYTVSFRLLSYEVLEASEDPFESLLKKR